MGDEERGRILDLYQNHGILLIRRVKRKSVRPIACFLKNTVFRPCNVAESKMFQLERQLEITVAGQYKRQKS